MPGSAVKVGGYQGHDGENGQELEHDDAVERCPARGHAQASTGKKRKIVIQFEQYITADHEDDVDHHLLPAGKIRAVRFSPAQLAVQKHSREVIGWAGGETEWHDEWCGQVEIVSCTEEEVAQVAAERVAYWREIADLLWELTVT